MKKVIRSILLLCLIALIALTAACGKTTPKPKPTASPATDADSGVRETAAPATEAPVPETETPTEETEAPAAETAAPVEETKGNDHSQVIEDNSVYKNELTDYQWVLMKVYQDGEPLSPSYYYGSVILQTGAQIEFKGDDTFECILGVKGCKGTYSIDTGVVTLHITTLYDGTDAGKDVSEDVTLTWDRTAGIIDFDYFGVTNEFIKRSVG